MANVDYVCLWQDDEGENHLTRCNIDITTGLPEGFPANATSILIVEYDHGYEPMFFSEATVSEWGLENGFG